MRFLESGFLHRFSSIRHFIGQSFTAHTHQQRGTGAASAHAEGGGERIAFDRCSVGSDAWERGAHPTGDQLLVETASNYVLDGDYRAFRLEHNFAFSPYGILLSEKS